MGRPWETPAVAALAAAFETALIGGPFSQALLWRLDPDMDGVVWPLFWALVILVAIAAAGAAMVVEKRQPPPPWVRPVPIGILVATVPDVQSDPILLAILVTPALGACLLWFFAATALASPAKRRQALVSSAVAIPGILVVSLLTWLIVGFGFGE